MKIPPSVMFLCLMKFQTFKINLQRYNTAIKTTATLIFTFSLKRSCIHSLISSPVYWFYEYRLCYGGCTSRIMCTYNDVSCHLIQA